MFNFFTLPYSCRPYYVYSDFSKVLYIQSLIPVEVYFSYLLLHNRVFYMHRYYLVLGFKFLHGVPKLVVKQVLDHDI